MKLKFNPLYSFLILLFFQLHVHAQQFNTQGNASQPGSFTYTITPNVLWQAGMVTNVYPLDLRQNFSINFQLNFGVNDASGADGFAFLLSNACSPTLTSGSGLGVFGIANSLIVEFDTWDNLTAFNDISTDHTGIYADGMLSAAGNIMDGATSPVCLTNSCGNVEDGQWHDVEIKWEYLSAVSQRISIFFDGVVRTASTKNHIAERFLNNNIVFWSVSGSTGGNSNLQQFRVASSSNNNINSCAGVNYTLTAPPLGTNYSWSGGSASVTNTASYSASITGIISCSYTDYCGVLRTVNFNVTANPNPAASVNSFTTCELTPQLIAATPTIAGSYSYAWTVPAGFTNPGNVASFSTNKAGTYSVVLTNTVTGCTSVSAFGTVAVTTAVQPLFAQVDTICKGSIVLPLPTTSLNGISGTWSPILNNQTTTTYTFTPNASACAFTASMNIIVNSTPEIFWNTLQTICKGETVILNPKATGDGLQFDWQDGSTDSVFTTNQPGIYSTTVSNSCGSDFGSVDLKEVICKIFVPSAFTPNNDRVNDLFRISGAAYVKDFSMQIFNRWGKVIYETKNALQGWDGLFAGLQQPAGLYVYRVQFTNLQTGEENNLKGNVMLIR